MLAGYGDGRRCVYEIALPSAQERAADGPGGVESAADRLGLLDSPAAGGGYGEPTAGASAAAARPGIND